MDEGGGGSCGSGWGGGGGGVGNGMGLVSAITSLPATHFPAILAPLSCDFRAQLFQEFVNYTLLCHVRRGAERTPISPQIASQSYPDLSSTNITRHSRYGPLDSTYDTLGFRSTPSKVHSRVMLGCSPLY